MTCRQKASGTSSFSFRAFSAVSLESDQEYQNFNIYGAALSISHTPPISEDYLCVQSLSCIRGENEYLISGTEAYPRFVEGCSLAGHPHTLLPEAISARTTLLAPTTVQSPIPTPLEITVLGPI